MVLCHSLRGQLRSVLTRRGSFVVGFASDRSRSAVASILGGVPNVASQVPLVAGVPDSAEFVAIRFGDCRSFASGLRVAGFGC